VRVRWPRLTATAMMSGTDGIRREQISPELVLVDPELAERARERLATEPFPRFEARRPAAGATRPRTAGSGRSRARVRFALAAVAALGTVAAIAAVANGVPSSLTRWVRGTERDTAGVVTPAERPTAQPTATADPRPPDAEGRSVGSPAPPPEQSGGAKERRPRKRQGSSHPGGRVFAWPGTAGTSFYVVDFFRGRQKIYEARPSAARLTLPSQWTFRGHRYRLAPGRYRWQVRAYSGTRSRPRTAKLVVSANLVIRAQGRG
jgi:hypothetical protein